MKQWMKVRRWLAMPMAWALTLAPACAEVIDETDEDLAVDGQLRTAIELPCEAEDADAGCTVAVDVESAESKNADVLDVVEFGPGFVLVEGVGEGKTAVIAKGNDKRFRIKYEVSAAASAGLRVDTLDVEALAH